MYGFLHCTKRFVNGRDEQVLFRDATFMFGPTERVAVLAPPGSGKSMLLRMLAGIEAPSSGQVVAPEGLSWPVGFAGLFHPVLTGEQNVRILATIFDADPDRTSAFVASFSELGDLYRQPMQQYSNGMRAKLAFSFSMAVPRRFYIADDIIGTGDEAFRLKCERMMLRRLKGAGLLFVTRSPRLAERFAGRFAVIYRHSIVECADLAEARVLLAKVRDEDEDFETILAGLSMA